MVRKEKDTVAITEMSHLRSRVAVSFLAFAWKNVSAV